MQPSLAGTPHRDFKHNFYMAMIGGFMLVIAAPAMLHRPRTLWGVKIITTAAFVYNLVVWIYTLVVVATLGSHLLDCEEKLHSFGSCGPQTLHWDD